MGLIKEFREFALKGNVIDLAVGVIIGGAFGTITNSLIKDIVMPVVGMAGKADFTNQYIALSGDVKTALATNPNLGLEDARKVGSVLAYGSFLTTCINFLILAFCIFMMVKLMNTARKRFEKQQAAAPVAPPAPTNDQILLAEIRDAIRAKG